MRKIIPCLDVFVYIAATLAIAGVFYEGMERRWFDTVGILIVIMDYSFLLSTIINLVAERKSKWLKVHIVSLLLIMIAVAMKLLKIPYPTVLLVLWYFYIWFLYGIRNVARYFDVQGKYGREIC